MPSGKDAKRRVALCAQLALYVQLAYGQLAILELLTDQPRAVCTDGSPGGFYFQAATDPRHAGDWVVHLQVLSRVVPSPPCVPGRWHSLRPLPDPSLLPTAHALLQPQGGGECVTPDECLHRAGTASSSSIFFPRAINFSYDPSLWSDSPGRPATETATKATGSQAQSQAREVPARPGAEERTYGARLSLPAHPWFQRQKGSADGEAPAAPGAREIRDGEGVAPSDWGRYARAFFHFVAGSLHPGGTRRARRG